MEVKYKVSSIRHKENIKEIHEESVAIHLLRPVVFNYKNDKYVGPKPTCIGLIAEEVERVMPQLVIFDIDGNAAGVHYEDLPVLLLREIQKQAIAIDDLQGRLDEMEEYLHALGS